MSPDSAKLKRMVLPLALVGVSGIGFLGWMAWRFGWTLEDLKAAVDSVTGFLEARPKTLYLALMTIPVLGFPLSPLLILGGVVYGNTFGTIGSILVTQSAVCLAMFWAYLASAYPCRRLMEDLLKRFEVPLPDLSRKGYRQVIFLIRAAPGLPFAFQNISLGLIKVPLVPYMLISTPVSLCYTTGFVMSGKALLEGNVALLIGALVVLVVVGMGIRHLVKRQGGAPPEIGEPGFGSK